jgi:hypothetical protein
MLCVFIYVYWFQQYPYDDDVRIGVLIRVTLLERDSLILPNHQSSLSFLVGFVLFDVTFSV